MNVVRPSIADRGPLPEEGGHLVMVVGQSGAGKDTMIGYARTALAGRPRFSFLKRVVTRPADDTEDNVYAGAQAFANAAAAGAYALHWWAHGHGYGVPAAGLRDALREGHVCVANVSRSVLAAAADVAAYRTVVELVASPEQIQARLRLRGRETPDAIADRVARQVDVDPFGAAHVVIRNDGEPADCGRAFASFLSTLEGVTRERQTR